MRIWYTHRWCPLQLSALNKSISLVCQNIVNTLLETVSQSKILNNKFWYEIASYIGTSAPLHCLRLFIRLVAGFVWVLNKRKREDSQLRSHFIHPFFIILCSHISLESVFSQLHQIWVQQGRDCSRIFCQKRPKDDFSSADSMIAGLTLNKNHMNPKSLVKCLLSVWFKLWSSLWGLPPKQVALRVEKDDGVQWALLLAKELWHKPWVSQPHEKWSVGSGPQRPLFQSTAAISQPHGAPPAVSVPFKKQSCVVNYWWC